MRQNFSQKLNVDASADRLKKLSNGCRLTGIALLLIAIVGGASYRGSTDAYDIFHFLLTAIGAAGLASLVCGHLLWRVIYGSFPSVFPDHGPDAK